MLPPAVHAPQNTQQTALSMVLKQQLSIITCISEKHFGVLGVFPSMCKVQTGRQDVQIRLHNFANRALLVAAPTLWNALPADICNASPMDIF